MLPQCESVAATRSRPEHRRSGSSATCVNIAVFANHPIPTDLKRLGGMIAPRPVLLIAAPNSGYGEELNHGYYRAAGQPKTLWEIPEFQARRAPSPHAPASTSNA